MVADPATAQLAPGCGQREYVYLGSQLLAAIDTSATGVSVGFASSGTPVLEGGTVQVPVVLESPGPLACGVGFEYSVTPVTALPGLDYTPPAQPWRGAFARTSENGATVEIPIGIVPDSLYEAEETLLLQITSVAGGAVGTSVYTITIQNDDDPPTVSVSDVSIAEGNGGLTQASFSVSLSAPSGLDASVAYATANGSATTPQDYVATSGVAFFPSGQTQTPTPVVVSVVGDGAYEADETFALNLSGPSGTTIADGQGLGTILNDDPPGISLNEVRGPEGEGGTTPYQFTVSIEGPAPGGASVEWSTYECTADVDDFVAASGTVAFAPNSTVPQTFTVLATGDTAVEGHEVFRVVLGNPVGASLKDAQGHGSLENDDAPFHVAALPAADFNGDGNPDILWFHRNSGNLVTWTMVGVNRSTGAYLNPSSVGNLNWRVVGTANFDLDPQPDILWRNETSGRLVAWLMSGLNRTSGVFLNPDQEPDLNWTVVGTGEFGTPPNADVDGLDILWRHGTTGALRVWIMGGIDRQAVRDVTGAAPFDANWAVIGTGDVDGDGDADIWWRNLTTGQLLVWRLNGTVVVEALTPNPAVLADTNWRAVATPDLDRDGHPDILWRHAVSGNLVVWLMNGTTRICGVYPNPPENIDLNWSVVGPR